MSYETWVSILLAVVAVMLGMVTFFATMVGLGIACVAIWGMGDIKQKASEAAKRSVKTTISQYPQATQFLELYRNLQGQLAEFQKEFSVWQQRSSDANAIMARLSAVGGVAASNPPEGENAPEPISQSYPTGEARPAVEAPKGGEQK